MLSAILNGINFGSKYVPPLDGCIDDALDVEECIKSKSEISSHLYPLRVKCLLDEDSKKQSILNSFREYLITSKSGDNVLFFYSGHGDHIPCYGGDEEDNWDECLVPADYDGTSSSLISDDEIAKIIAQKPPGVILTCVFDACHSGTMTKELPKKINKFLHVNNDSCISLSACRDDQTSADARFGVDGRPNGALTRCWLDVLKSIPGITWVQIIEEINKLLKKECFSQVAQLSGPLELLNSYPFGGI